MRYWLSKIEASGAYRDLCFAARQAGIGILVIEIHILPSGALKSITHWRGALSQMELRTFFRKDSDCLVIIPS